MGRNMIGTIVVANTTKVCANFIPPKNGIRANTKTAMKAAPVTLLARFCPRM